jgi:MinD superfamily P-loop ATPase
MKIAVLSGKGGVGKTLVSVNLAALTQGAVYVDCDVEEPNGHLFFKPQQSRIEDISVLVPCIDKAKCDGCRICVDFCAFNALAFIQGKPLLFAEVCHSCGGCTRLCPQDAIAEVAKTVGTLEKGMSESITVYGAAMILGETSGMPLVRELLRQVESEKGLVFLDCPPGSACLVMECVREADYCVLVAEPTLFGVHNLAMIHELVEHFGKPVGVVLNKTNDDENPSEEYCLEQGLSILGKIPFDYVLAEKNSDAQIVVRDDERYKKIFSAFLERIVNEARK